MAGPTCAARASTAAASARSASWSVMPSADVEQAPWICRRHPTRHRVDVGALGDESPGEVGADEAGAARDERVGRTEGGHGAGVVCQHRRCQALASVRCGPDPTGSTMLEQCLASLRASLGPDDELLVVDSASSDPRVGVVAEAHGATVPAVRACRASSRARNVGWRAARHEVVAVRGRRRAGRCPGGPTALGRVPVTARPAAAFVTGRIRLPPGRGVDRRAGRRQGRRPSPPALDAATTGAARSQRQPGRAAARAPGRRRLRRARWAPGPTSVAAEDNDLWDRLFAAGFVGRYEPEASAWHEQWRTRRQLLRLNWALRVRVGCPDRQAAPHRPAAGRTAARIVFWDWGVADAFRWLPRFRSAWRCSRCSSLAAALALVRALPVPLRSGHFAPGPLPGAPRRGRGGLGGGAVPRCGRAISATLLGTLVADGSTALGGRRRRQRLPDRTRRSRSRCRTPARAGGRRSVAAGPGFARNAGAAAASARTSCSSTATTWSRRGTSPRMHAVLGGADLVAARPTASPQPGVAGPQPAARAGGRSEPQPRLPPLRHQRGLGCASRRLRGARRVRAMRAGEDVDLCWRAQRRGMTSRSRRGQSCTTASGRRAGAPSPKRWGTAGPSPCCTAASAQPGRHRPPGRAAGREGLEARAHRLVRTNEAPFDGVYLTGLAVGRALGSARHRATYL